MAERVTGNEPAGGQHGHSRDAAVQRVAMGPAPTGSDSAMPVVQRHASFEHRMLGDVPPDDLFDLGAHQEMEQARGNVVSITGRDGGRQRVLRSNIEHVLEQELRRLQVWQTQDPKISSMDSIGNKLGAAKANLETDVHSGEAF